MRAGEVDFLNLRQFDDEASMGVGGGWSKVGPLPDGDLSSVTENRVGGAIPSPSRAGGAAGFLCDLPACCWRVRALGAGGLSSRHGKSGGGSLPARRPTPHCRR